MAKCEHQRAKSTCSTCSPEAVYNQYRYKSVKQRHLVFTLSVDEFKKLVEQPCFYCGEQSEPRGIDRRDNRIGYVIWNSQSCCGVCNKIKGTFGEQFLMNHIEKMWRQAQRRKQSRIPQPMEIRPNIETESPAVVRTNLPGRVLDPRVSPDARRFLNGI
jgi:hypothetical protein